MINLQKSSKTVLLLIFFLGIANSSFAQDQTRFVLKLDNDLVSSFRSYGSLRSEVPKEFREKISFVELQYAETRDNEAVVQDLGIQVNGENANIVLDEKALKAVKAQPVRVPVSQEQSSFSQIVLIYNSAASPVTKETELKDTGQLDYMYYVRLNNTQTMAGTIDGFDKFEIATQFGKISMPMDRVAGIKFHTDTRDSAIIVLNNGDSITGVPTIPAISLMTDWGQADIEPKYIDSLTTTPSATFSQQNTDFGTRWKLRTGSSFSQSASRMN